MIDKMFLLIHQKRGVLTKKVSEYQVSLKMKNPTSFFRDRAQISYTVYL